MLSGLKTKVGWWKYTWTGSWYRKIRISAYIWYLCQVQHRGFCSFESMVSSVSTAKTSDECMRLTWPCSVPQEWIQLRKRTTRNTPFLLLPGPVKSC